MAPFGLEDVPITFKQPYRSLFIAYQALLLIFLIPAWVFYYTVFPRPRATWTLRETMDVEIIRKVAMVKCHLTPSCNDKRREVSDDSLKETSFCWLEPADRIPSPSIVRREALDELVFPVHVLGYLWPKGADVYHTKGLFGIFSHVSNAGESFSDSGSHILFPFSCYYYDSTRSYNLDVVRNLIKVCNLTILVAFSLKTNTLHVLRNPE